MFCRCPSIQHTLSLSPRLLSSFAIGSILLLGMVFGVPEIAVGAEMAPEFSGIIIGTFQGTPQNKIAGE